MIFSCVTPLYNVSFIMMLGPFEHESQQSDPFRVNEISIVSEEKYFFITSIVLLLPLEKHELPMQI